MAELDRNANAEDPDLDRINFLIDVIRVRFYRARPGLVWTASSLRPRSITILSR
jgi:hypothetical protein